MSVWCSSKEGSHEWGGCWYEPHWSCSVVTLHEKNGMTCYIILNFFLDRTTHLRFVESHFWLTANICREPHTLGKELFVPSALPIAAHGKDFAHQSIWLAHSILAISRSDRWYMEQKRWPKSSCWFILSLGTPSLFSGLLVGSCLLKLMDAIIVHIILLVQCDKSLALLAPRGHAISDALFHFRIKLFICSFLVFPEAKTYGCNYSAYHIWTTCTRIIFNTIFSSYITFAYNFLDLHNRCVEHIYFSALLWENVERNFHRLYKFNA
jgi:hypothetical protein